MIFSTSSLPWPRGASPTKLWHSVVDSVELLLRRLRSSGVHPAWADIATPDEFMTRIRATTHCRCIEDSGALIELFPPTPSRHFLVWPAVASSR